MGSFYKRNGYIMSMKWMDCENEHNIYSRNIISQTALLRLYLRRLWYSLYRAASFAGLDRLDSQKRSFYVSLAFLVALYNSLFGKGISIIDGRLTMVAKVS
jgi:hypothetical protein